MNTKSRNYHQHCRQIKDDIAVKPEKLKEFEALMQWNELSSLKKFIPLKDIFENTGLAQFKLGSRPVYYLGNGFLLSYSSKMFRVENNNRVEYGAEGEYALSAYYFNNKHELEAYFKIKNEQFPLGRDSLGSENFEIVEGIDLNSTYEQVAACLKPTNAAVYYQEGETRALNNGSFEFQNNFVSWGNYVFFFFGKSNKTKVSGFEYTLPE